MERCFRDSERGAKDDRSITIWTGSEDYKNQHYLDELGKKFPDCEVVMKDMNSSTIALKVLKEGDKCEYDIILSDEYGYLCKCEEYLAGLTDFDSFFIDEIVPVSRRFNHEAKNGGTFSSLGRKRSD